MTSTYKATLSRIADNFGRRELLSLAEAEEVLGLDRRTIIGHRLLPIQKIGGKLCVSVADIAELLTRTAPRRR